MRPLASVATALFTLGLASTAYAEPREPATPRARFAIGGYAGGAGLPDWHGGGGVGAYVRGGIQYTELLGFDAQGSFTTALFLGAARGALTAELSPTDWFSIGSGASANAFYLTGIGSSGYSACMFGLPLRLAFHTGGRRADQSRRGLELMVEGDAGLAAFANRSTRNGDLALALYVGIGYARF